MSESKAREGENPADLSPSAPGSPEWIALYSGREEMRQRLESLLANTDLETAESRATFSVLLRDRRGLGVVGMDGCSSEEAAWLGSVVTQLQAGQSLVVVAPRSLSFLKCFRALGQVVVWVAWDTVAGEQLASFLGQIGNGRRNPLKSLGRRILAVRPLRPALYTAVTEICRLSSDAGAGPPKKSVSEVARLVGLSPATLCRYWKAEVPLRCGPKRLLGWSGLLWALEQRSVAKWDVVASQMGLRRRTLERRYRGLAGCTLGEAARDPAVVRTGFQEWVKEVWDLPTRRSHSPARPRRRSSQT